MRFMATPIIGRDYSVDPEHGVAPLGGSRFTLEECEAAEDARLSIPQLSYDPESGPVWRGGHGYKRPKVDQ